jgi:hypothetical protein
MSRNSRDALRVTLRTSSDALGLLAATPSERRHSWHPANFTATAAAWPYDSVGSIMPAGWSNWTMTGPDRHSGKRTARPRDLRERARRRKQCYAKDSELNLKQRHRATGCDSFTCQSRELSYQICCYRIGVRFRQRCEHITIFCC